MKPGIYPTAETTAKAEAAYWAEFGYTFGTWQFLPETGEIRRNGVFDVRLSPTEAYQFGRLVEAYPKYIASDASGALKETVCRLRKKVGAETIVAVHCWGYRFAPEAVL